MAEEKKPTGLKISVVGPSGAGKSTIANFLAADSDRAQFKLASAYVPTVGVRILECERAVGGGPASAVELWDTGGSTDYESCWPAIMKDTAGVILVYNPDNEGHVSESGAWYDYFVKNNELPDEACVVFAFDPNAQRGTRQRTSPKLQHLNVINASLEDGPFLLQQFDRFLRAVKHKRDGAGEDK
ncbi:GTP binding protein [Aureococcus anophagefferens]|uniref:GTP binding protein n=2 Tax=Aureococcus anophagefferens TaxID=44056 RepID=A0ABR1FZ34_AURAN|nr:GTP binding protein [Aureococcus anophagefferens]KAH8070834.1 GTP binding protein [Aureococcus anophagefferens]